MGTHKITPYCYQQGDIPLYKIYKNPNVMFKLIKSKEWTSSTGSKGTTLTVAYKGRVFIAQANDFAGLKIDKDKQTVSFGEECEVVAENYTNELGQVKQGLRLKPKMDLSLAAF